ncbi:hypothetical protein AN219_34310 [Streptomyces nanshensis]|nr:hypothetical protein AN219_34310 [Streptomyces nanshensis]
MTAQTSSTEAFFEQVSDDRYVPTENTRGPWSAGSQHAGPPAALLGRAVRTRTGAREDMRLARITFEITRPVPLKPLTVVTRVVREGRSVELVEASLTPEGGEEVMRARALRIRTLPGAVPQVTPEPEVPGPGSAEPEPFFPVPWDVGYHTAMETRFVHGSFLAQGPAACWMRMRVPLVDGEKVSPLDRVLTAADSGNGVSNVLDFSQHVFVNPDLTVHLHRHPVGDWVCVDARTSIDAAGVGMSEAALHDEHGPIGRGVQSLFVAPRD